MTPTGNEGLEQRFSRLLLAADSVARMTSEIHIKELHPLDPESYPAITVIKLERQATIEFRATLPLLTDPVLAYCAEILRRSLLEAMAQLWRIHGIQRSSVASRRRRAICFEYGSISALYRASRPRRDKKGRPYPSTRSYSNSQIRASIRKRYVLVKRLHETTCPPGCAGTSASQLSEALLNMSKRHKTLRWAWPMYEVASMSAHQVLQRGLATADPATLAIVPMSLADRAAEYDRLLTAYAVSVDLAARIHMPQLQAFRQVAIDLKKAVTALHKEIGALQA